METIVSFYLFLFVTLELFLVKSQVFTNTNNHDFNNDLDVKVLVNGIPVIIPKEFSSSSEGRLKDPESDALLSSSIRFQPSLLDFKERYLGIPHHEKVTIINLSHNKTIRLSSISGSTVHFHSSFFEDKLIPPLGNTTFNVVFLGREEGEVESNLYIHTSLGSLKYQVRGISIQSPYRLRPLSGIRLPLNASFSPLINLHNPYSTPIQLVEVFSSGGDFHLELPSGELEGPKQLWEIPAFYTKPVIRVRFHAQSQKNHTAYIRLKVNHSEEVLIVPLEVEVSQLSGVYSPDDMIDFGIGGNQDPPKTLRLYLKNSWKKPVKIQNIVSMPPSKALKIEFEPIKVPPDSQASTKVASLTFDWKLAQEINHTKGKLVIKSTGVGGGVEKLVISYIARTLQGGLIFDVPVIEYRPLSQELYKQPFHIKNTFALPVVITNVTMPPEALQQFKIVGFKPVIVKPGERVPIFKLDLVDSSDDFISLETEITLHSNVSSIKIPLLRYNGHLMKVTESGDDLIIGTVGSKSVITTNVGLVNSNPASVRLRSWGSNLPSVSIEFLGTSINSFTCISQPTSCDLADSKTIDPGHQAVLKVSIKTEKSDGVINGDVWVESEFERASFTLQMKVVDGKIKIVGDPILFKNCFPEQVCSTPLEITSEFSFPMNVVNIMHTSPLSEGITFVPEESAKIEPMTSSVVGRLYWNPPAKTFHSLLHNSTESQQFLDSLSLPLNVAEWDFQMLTKQMNTFLANFSNPLNFTLKMDTSEVRRHLFNAQIPLTWPSISSHSIEFPLTLIGNQTFKNVTVINFSSKDPIIVQITPFILYKDYLENAAGLSNFFNFTGETTPYDSSRFSIYVEESSVWEYQTAHRASILYLIPPSSNLTLSICFTPSMADSVVEYIAIRNNLTTLELVKLHGTGTEIQFKFGNRKPGSDSPLLFELTEKHLKDCEKDNNDKKDSAAAPNLTVKRSFTARNTGELPILILGYLINGLPNEGYGFKVLNAEPFVLLPNSTRKVEIAFTPDFTLARIERTISIITDMSIDTNYSLVATLPSHMLAPCSAALRRPVWEPVLYYMVLGIKLILLVCIIVASFFESERLLKSVVITRAQDAATQPVLDLRNIADKDVDYKTNNIEKVGGKEPAKTSAANSGETFCDSSSQSCLWLNFASSISKDKSEKEKTKSKSGICSTLNSNTLKKRAPSTKNSESSSWSNILNSTPSSILGLSNASRSLTENTQESSSRAENTSNKGGVVKSGQSKTNLGTGDFDIPKKAGSNKKTKSKSKKENGTMKTSLTKKNLDEWNSSHSSPSSSNSSCHEKDFKKNDSRSSTSTEFRDVSSKPSTPKQIKCVDKTASSWPNGNPNIGRSDTDKDDCDKPNSKKTKAAACKNNASKQGTKMPSHKKTNSLDLSVNFEVPPTNRKVKTALTNVKSLPLTKTKDKTNFNSAANHPNGFGNNLMKNGKIWEDEKPVEYSRAMARVQPLTQEPACNFNGQSFDGNQNKPLRMSFSDVVARTENHHSLFSSSSNKLNKSVNFSVPPPEPIGPKKSITSMQRWGNSPMNLFSNIPPIGSSEKVWDQSLVLKMLEEERKRKDAQIHNALIDSWPNSIPSLWADPPSTSTQNSENLLGSNSVWSNPSPSPLRSSSVWSNEVWAPISSTAVPRTPLRPPPGLGPSNRAMSLNPPTNINSNLVAQPQLFEEKDRPFRSSNESSEKARPSQEYDPFRSLSSIWSSPSPSIWNSNSSPAN